MGLGRTELATISPQPARNQPPKPVPSSQPQPAPKASSNQPQKPGPNSLAVDGVDRLIVIHVRVNRPSSYGLIAILIWTDCHPRLG